MQSHLVEQVVRSPRRNTACVTHFSHLSRSPASIVLSRLISLPASPTQLWTSSGWHKTELLRRAGEAEELSSSCGSFHLAVQSPSWAGLGALLRQLCPSKIQRLGKPTPGSAWHPQARIPARQGAHPEHPQPWLGTHGCPRQCPACRCHGPSQPAKQLRLVAAALPVNTGSIFLRDNLSP